MAANPVLTRDKAARRDQSEVLFDNLNSHVTTCLTVDEWFAKHRLKAYFDQRLVLEQVLIAATEFERLPLYKRLDDRGTGGFVFEDERIVRCYEMIGTAPRCSQMQFRLECTNLSEWSQLHLFPPCATVADFVAMHKDQADERINGWFEHLMSDSAVNALAVGEQYDINTDTRVAVWLPTYRWSTLRHVWLQARYAAQLESMADSENAGARHLRLERA